MAGRRGWGWAGPVSEFLATDDDTILIALEAHHRGLLNMAPSADAQRAWQEELAILRAALRRLQEGGEGIGSWSVVFEYELPLEGGRRPDVVLLTNGRVIVLEFKSPMTPSVAQLDQVEAYARDLSEYHEATHGVPVDPVLVLARSAAAPRVVHVSRLRVEGRSTRSSASAQAKEHSGPRRLAERELHPASRPDRSCKTDLRTRTTPPDPSSRIGTHPRDRRTAPDADTRSRGRAQAGPHPARWRAGLGEDPGRAITRVRAGRPRGGRDLLVW